MITARWIAIAGALASACASSGEMKRSATVGDVTFDAPADWVLCCAPSMCRFVS